MANTKDINTIQYAENKTQSEMEYINSKITTCSKWHRINQFSIMLFLNVSGFELEEYATVMQQCYLQFEMTVTDRLRHSPSPLAGFEGQLRNGG